MGEIAEMMMEGILCEGCGVALVTGPNDEIPGYPRKCASCEEHEKEMDDGEEE
jgi:hypothetical protein